MSQCIQVRKKCDGKHKPSNDVDVYIDKCLPIPVSNHKLPPLYVLDDQKAKLYQLFTHIKTRDNNMVYTTWIIFQGLEYFDGLLESSLSDSNVRLIKFDFLDVPETCIYLDLLITGCSANASPMTLPTCLNIYKQLDFHLIKSSIRDDIQRQIGSHKYCSQLYKFNMIYKVISKPILAKMLVTQIMFPDIKLSDNEILGDLVTDYDQEFVSQLFKQLTGNPLTVWLALKNFPPSIREKHISECNPRMDLLSLSECLAKYGQDPSALLYVQHVLNIWSTKYQHKLL